MPATAKWGGLLFGFFLAILIPFLIWERTVRMAFHHAIAVDLDPLWLAGLISLLLASDVVLPVPSSLASTTAGAALGFGLGTLTSWVGMSVGCLLGYWVGKVAGAPAARYLVGGEELEKATRLGRQFGGVALVMTRAVPILAEASVISAGVARVPPRVFFLVTGLANLGISFVYAGIGAFAYGAHSFLLVFGGAILVPGSALLLTHLWSRSPFPTTGSFDTRGLADYDVTSEQESGSITQRFSVTFDYPVFFTNGVFDPANRLLAQIVSRREPSRRHDLVVFVDDGVAAAWSHLTRDIELYGEAHPNRLRLVTSPIPVPGGEQSKNDSRILEMIYRRLFELCVDRHSFIVAVGGGAVLDTVGYAAATTHRGVRLVRIPTTVLAQNDAGVGVKTGVNLCDAKNFLGAFAPPFAVINDVRFLHTLSSRDRRAGIAEAVKVALIKDRPFFDWLERHAQRLSHFEDKAMAYMVRHCAELHLAHIASSGDPFETGNVRPLDYGHWLAHKLESLTKHEIRHGEAVAIGIALDTRYAVQIGLLNRGTDDRVCQLLEQLGFQLWHPVMGERNPKGELRVIDGLREFREHLGGGLSVTLLAHIGKRVEVNEMDHRELEQGLYWLEARSRRS